MKSKQSFSGYVENLHDSYARRDVYKLSIALIYPHCHFVRIVGLKIKMLQLEELPFARTGLNL